MPEVCAVKAVGLSLLLVLPGAAVAGPVALLVGNDEGLPTDGILRHTEDDTSRVGAVLTELGGFAPGDVHRLAGARAEDVLASLDALAPAPSPLFFFYYSGHADSAALHLRGTRLPVAVLLEHLQRVHAGMRLVVLDACQSGAAARGKGVRPGPAFTVQVRSDTAEGQVLISSSAANEQSFESDALRGALFTLNLTAGLRGAADQNGDNVVTLGEAYAYAYAQTLRATLLSSSGPQHPSFHWDLVGSQDPVLTRLKSSAALTFASEDEGQCVVFDEHEREVVAELPVRPSERRKLALAPGRYLVKVHGTRSLRVARVELGEGDDRVLEESRMETIPFVHLARKGALGDVWVRAAYGVYSSGLGVSSMPMLELGAEAEHRGLLWGASLMLATGAQEAEFLAARQTDVGLALEALFTVPFRDWAFRVGPTAGLVYVEQKPEAHPVRRSLGGLVGLRGRVDLTLVSNVGLFAAADLRGLVVRVADTPPRVALPLGGGVDVLAWGSFLAGVRVSW